MLNIPEDLYPIADLRSIQRILDEYMDFTCRIYSSDFSNVESLKQYLSRFCSTTDAEKFLESGAILFRLNEQPDTSIRLVMLIALIEKIVSTKYINLQSWFNDKNSEVKGIIEFHSNEIKNSNDAEIKDIIKNEIIDKFYERYGATKSFVDFIQKYMKEDDQFTLITNFQFIKKDVPTMYTSRYSYQPQVNTLNELKAAGITTSTTHVPLCHNWKMCYSRFLGCEPDEGCLIREEKQKFNETIRKLAKKIYTMRSEIVHNASNKGILTGSEMASFSYILIDGKSAVISMTIDQIQDIFARTLKRYFDEKLIPVY